MRYICLTEGAGGRGGEDTHSRSILGQFQTVMRLMKSELIRISLGGKRDPRIVDIE